MKNASSDSRVSPCGQRDGHDVTDSHFSQFLRKSVETNIDMSIANPTIEIAADECIKVRYVSRTKRNPSRKQEPAC
jgi:hypothetical protein